MISITQSFKVPNGLSLMGTVVPASLISTFAQLREFSKEYGCVGTVSYNTNAEGQHIERIEVNVWESQAKLDEFMKFANATFDYDNIYKEICTYVESLGGTVTVTREET